MSCLRQMKGAAALCACLLLCLGSAGCTYREVPVPLPTETSAAVPTAAPAPLPTATPCPHEVWDEGVCAGCAERCAHTWEEGLCAVCGEACSHESHDAETRRCIRCAALQRHRYAAGVCACGAAYDFSAQSIPTELCAICPEQGTLETITYTAPDYLRQAAGDVGREWEKNIVVYLPYGYDPAKQYDLLILMHGDGCGEKYWLQEEHEVDKGSGSFISMRNVLDNLIARRLCSEMIVACPTFYGYDADGYPHRANTSEIGVGYERELREIVLPMLAERYSTYAASGSPEDLRRARDHIGYAGFSRGSIIGYGSVLTECRDMISWIGCLSCIADSPNYSMAYYIQGTLTDGEHDAAEYPIHLLYSGGGEDDPAWHSQKNHMNVLHQLENQLTEGENSLICPSPGRHEFKAWSKGLYDCLQLFFAYDAVTMEKP